MPPNNYQSGQAGLFDVATPTPRRITVETVPFGKAKKRRSARPAHISRIPRGTDIGAAHAGSTLLGLPLTRQGEEIAAVCAADRPDGRALYRIVTVLIERRTAKTTTVWSIMLGRCLEVSFYKVIYTAQSGILARRRFLDVIRGLVAIDFEGIRNPLNRLGQIRRANGNEAILFDNGSEIRIVPPDAGAFRGEAADLVVFDEAGELDPEKSDDLLGAATPLINTRPRGQILIVGTPGPTRAGLLWDNLQKGITKEPRSGVVAYMLPEGEQWGTLNEDGEFIPDWAIVKKWHPGIPELTRLEDLQHDLTLMGIEKWAAEYLCVFPNPLATSALDAAAWDDCSAGTQLPDRPQKLGIAFDIEPDGTRAALVAAWRDPAGLAHFEVLETLPGSEWLIRLARTAATKYKCPIAFDGIGVNHDIGAALTRLRVATLAFQLKDMGRATARFARIITTRTARHYDQPDLTAAIQGAAWRSVGDTKLLGRTASNSSVCTAVAAAIALWVYDERIAKRTTAAGSTIKTGTA